MVTAVATLGQTIRTARRDCGWTQATLAESAGVSRPTIARIESGRDISATSLGKIATALDLRLCLLPRQQRGR